MWNIRKFHLIYRGRDLSKTNSRNKGFTESVGKIFRFPSFNPVFKNTKIRYVFGTIRENAPNNWNKIGHTFAPLKYRPNKGSGKLKMKPKIVRVTIFCVKILLTRDGDSPLLTWYMSVVWHWTFLSWRQNYLFLEHFKRSFSIIMYYMQSIFHEACLFFSLSSNCDTSRPVGNSWTANLKKKKKFITMRRLDKSIAEQFLLVHKFLY